MHKPTSQHIFSLLKSVCIQIYTGKNVTKDQILAELLADTLSDIYDNSDSDSSITGYKQNKSVYKKVVSD